MYLCIICSGNKSLQLFRENIFSVYTFGMKITFFCYNTISLFTRWNSVRNFISGIKHVSQLLIAKTWEFKRENKKGKKQCSISQ